MDLHQYQRFVESLTPPASQETGAFIERINQLADDSGVNIPLLLTAAAGLTAESGEFMEIPKKCIFQGKPLDEHTQFHLKRELGDVMWYWMNACRALNLDPQDVINENINKLKSRYPGGEFDVMFSENRKEGDL